MNIGEEIEELEVQLAPEPQEVSVPDEVPEHVPAQEAEEVEV